MSPQRILDEAGLPEYLAEAGLFPLGAELEIRAAGDGNINWVRCVRSGARSLVVKQARPTLEKFPEYEAPTERIACEARWIERAQPFDEDGLCPELLHFDLENRVLVLEDLSDSERLDHALARGAEVTDAARAIAALLGRVHAATRRVPAEEITNAFANDGMRRLHGEHIFALPFQPNDFPMPFETAKAARRIQQDPELGAIAARAYERYLAPEGALVHADVQAGNVLLVAGRPKLLDAEIAHLGDPAFDVGTLLAHLALPALARGDADGAAPLLAATWERYTESHGAEGLPPRADAMRYAGLELVRRTIGAARVAAVETDAAGLRVLSQGERWIREPAA